MKFNWRETHHLYYGVILTIIGLVLFHILSGCWTLISFPFLVLGIWCAGDDIYQHIRQITEPEFQSSIHRWFVRKLYPNPIIRKLNVWLDNFFKKV